MSYVRFYSESSFTLGTNGNVKMWNGTASNAMEYSIDADTWSTWTGTSAISAGLSNGVYNLYLRGTGNTKVSNSTSTSITTKFVFTGTELIDSEGNIESLLDYTTVDNNQHPTMNTYAFTCLFYNQTLLRTALDIGSETVSSYGCYSMFQGCTSLTTPPSVLPATTLNRYCYNNMFYECTSLITAPELPATTLANYCYYYMFYGCESLTTPPSVLPATTLNMYCYNSMFYGCTSLTTAPELLATTLASYCCCYMFTGCTSLTIAPSLPATTLASSCYYSMFARCTSLTIPPSLPATTLALRCYYMMFQNCTSLTTPPSLPATTLTDECYRQMFYNTGIKLSTTQHGDYTLAYRIPAEGTGIDGTNSLTYMFNGSGVDTPSINTTYYIKDAQYKSSYIELGAVAQAIRDKAEISSSLTFPEDYITEINNIVVDIDNTYLISQAIPSDVLGTDGDICIVYN